ncbi:MAG TPA: ATP-binding SpoIIE family protein phosphatase [Bryobacteraceae bacterium]|jgi:anti-sigma regulatory factor (Ser/Thr protein kinase)|nr:ATP-binding SpoIIE family protein phosphatase [Bryobacteraceae bacterium]
MPQTTRVRIDEQSRTAEARRTARLMAQNLGFDETLAEQAAIVTTEVCTNLLKHAGGGEILLQQLDGIEGGAPALELLALDKGPGIGNLDQALRDGYSTGGSPGHGLGAIVRLASVSDFYSEPARGAAVLARWTAGPETPAWRVPPLQIGAVNIAKPGQDVCGDDWGVEQTPDYSVIMVADGLGHGTDARVAAAEAVRILHSAPALSPAELVERAHLALRSTRGAALAVARIDRGRDRVTFSGIGNISAHIYSGVTEGQHLVSVHGTAGFQTAKIREFEYPWPDHGMLLMYSDGLATHTSPSTYPGLSLRDPTLIAGVLYRDFARRTDDATVVTARAA